MNDTTAHSEYGLLKHVFLKSIAEGFINQEFIGGHWKELNYIAQPDYQKAILEYATFVNIIRQTGCEISFFERDNSTGMDSIYCRDAAIATNSGIILCNMGKGQRSGEPQAQNVVYESNKLRIMGAITGPGTLEGGDVAWIDESTLAVGHGYRTNLEGIRQLENLLRPIGVSLVVVDLPHYKGPADVFHLMSIFSPIDKDLAVVYSPLMTVSFRNLLLDKGYTLIEVPDEEFESMGCNVLALSPRVCVMVNENPVTEYRLKNSGCAVYTYPGKHISVMGGGGPTCLTRPIIRQS